MIEKEISMADLASVLDMNLNDPEVYDLSDFGLQVESVDNHGDLAYRNIEEFMVKPKVDNYYQLGDLRGTANHRVLYNNEFIELKNHPDAERMEGNMDVVDIVVDDTERYIANGQINHNTTSGGII